MLRRRTLLGAHPINIQADEVDDEAEKRQNAQPPTTALPNSSVRVTRTGTSKTTTATATTPQANRPNTTPITPAAPKPSNEQLGFLYNNCIKLLNENKINQKNAFQLKLIDYLSDIVLNKDIVGSDTNFQVVGCTIDAGTKIYAARVDALHQNAYQVLSGLGYNNENDGDAASNDMDIGTGVSGEGGLNESNDDENQNKQKTQRKRRLKKSYLVESTEQITSKCSDELVDYDLYFSKVSTAIEQEAIAGLLINKLIYKDDCLEFLINRDDVYLDQTVLNRHIEAQNVETLKIQKLDECLRECNKRINVDLDNFHFIGWDASNISSNGQSNDPFDTIINQFNQNVSALQEPEININSSLDRFDDNANLLENYDAEPEMNPSSVSVHLAGSANDEIMHDIADNIVIMEERLNLNQIDDIHSIGHTLHDVTTLMESAVQPSDYSYFNFDRLKLQNLSKHLKSMAVRMTASDLSNQQAINTQELSKATKVKRKRQIPLLDFKEEHDYSKLFKQTNKAICLSDRIIEKRADYGNHLEIEREYNYNPKQLFQLYGKEIAVKVMSAHDTQNDFENLLADGNNARGAVIVQRDDDYKGDDDIEGGDHGGACDDDNFDLPPTAAPNQENNFYTQGGGEFNLATQAESNQNLIDYQNPNIDADYLIQAPEQVNAIHLEYAKTAKYIDAKKLKSALWALICKHSGIKENSTDDIINCTLTEIYPLLKPPVINQKAFEDLSVCIVFQMLLFLANEHNLRLVHKPDGSDIQITRAELETTIDKM